MQPQDVAELLRATASDADAVAQYLGSIDREELNGLLDGFAAHETKKKSEPQRGDWLALVQLLLRSDTGRLRTATRIIQLVWNGSLSELECMQWLTEISLSYLSVLEASCSDESARHERAADAGRIPHRVRCAAVASEVRMLVRMLLELLPDGIEAHGSANPRRALSQVLGLLPVLLDVLVELARASGDADASDHELNESLVVLLELPWTARTVPLLLDLLKESASIVSPSGWQQLRETVARMLMTPDSSSSSQAVPSESMNAIIRECVAIASVTGSCHWITIARHVMRQLPARLRPEAEFTLQMCLHQSPDAVALVCESIRLSLDHERDCVADALGDRLDPALDWRDLVFLFHALQVSRPILHHRTTSSRIATDARVFRDIERLTWTILRLDVARAAVACAAQAADARSFDALAKQHVAERVAHVLTFGGAQVHAREWKALLLMDFALYWLEQRRSAADDATGAAVEGLAPHEAAQFERVASAFPSTDALARMLLLSVYQSAPEIRAEMLSSLFEGTKSPDRVQVAGKALDQLFRTQRASLFAHVHAIQDWLSVLFQNHFGYARAFFLMASQLLPTHKGTCSLTHSLASLYHFLMVFLRKLLSTSSGAHQQFAIDLWCAWLEQAIRLDAVQEEEVVSALKSSLAVCPSARAWTLGRLEQMFQCGVALRQSSWEELHRVLASELAQFICAEPADGHESDDGSGDDDDERQRFHVTALDQFYHENTSADGAAAVGLVFQRALSCLLAFEAAAAAATVLCERGDRADAALGLPAVGAKVLRWTLDFVSNSARFFHWIAQTSSSSGEDDESDGDSAVVRAVLRRQGASAGRKHTRARPLVSASALEKETLWRLLSRIGIGSALCSVAIEQLLQQQQVRPSRRHGTAAAAVSMWPLLEVQLCLHRLLRKLATGAAIDMKQPKEYLATSLYGIASVVDAQSAQILTDVSARLAPSSSSSAQDARCGAPATSDLSFDSLRFVVDSCSSSSATGTSGGGRSAVSPAPAQTFRQRASAERMRVLDALLQLYVAVHARAFGSARAADAPAAPVFTVYADALAAKFPSSLRHFVVTPAAAKDVVLLDASAAEDLLVRVFAAIHRVVDAVIAIVGVHDADAQVHALLAASARVRGGFAALAVRLLSDLDATIARRKLSKLKVTTAKLVKRLCDLGADVASRSSSSSRSAKAFTATMLQVSDMSYRLLVDHVVDHAPLLRVLLSLCMSVHLGHAVATVVALAGKLEGVLLAAGFDVALVRLTRARRRRPLPDASHARHRDVSSSDDDDDDDDVAPRTPRSRKRLRQVAVTAAEPSPPSPLTTECVAAFQPPPHLASSTAHTAAIYALVTLLDASHAALYKQLASREPLGAPVHATTVTQYVCISERVLCALLTAKDGSWVDAKALLKLLSVTEWCLRIARACVRGHATSVRKRAACSGDDDADDWPRACAEVLESAVEIGIRGRDWLGVVRESVSESSAKTKLSATSLKIDVFLSSVPQLVQSFVKETHLSSELRDRVRAMLSRVANHLTPGAVPVAASRSKSATAAAKRRVHMIGLVPIVKKRKRRLRSRHPYIDDWLRDEDGSDAYADLEDFIE